MTPHADRPRCRNQGCNHVLSVADTTGVCVHCADGEALERGRKRTANRPTAGTRALCGCGRGRVTPYGTTCGFCNAERQRAVRERRHQQLTAAPPNSGSR
jgi:hypothetical protein